MSQSGHMLVFRCLRLAPAFSNRVGSLNLSSSLCSNRLHKTSGTSKALSVLGLNRAYCTSNIPYESEETPVVYKNGFPVVNILMPSRDERCLFTLRPLTDTVGSFLKMVQEEDGGVERIAVYRKDGSKIAKATTIDMLFQEDFDLLINSRKFLVVPPQVDMPQGEAHSVEQVKDLISQLYTQMNLAEWHASREKELSQTIENLKHELTPYEKLRIEMVDASNKRTRMWTWAGMTGMGIQFGFLARLTWWEYSWDIMEPVTYFVTYGTSLFMFAYYVLTKQEYVYPEIKDRAFLLHLHKLAEKNNYDIEHYNDLMVKLSKAEEDLDKLKQPIGLTLSEIELQSLLSAKQQSSN